MLAGLVLITLIMGSGCVVPHTEPDLPLGWSYSGSPPSAVEFRLSLKQRNLGELQRIASRVSDPDDEMYGKYLAQHQIDEITSPPASAIATVMDWAKSSNGCTASFQREVVTVKCMPTAAEALLSTVCRKVHNSATQQAAVRCSDYSLPDEVHSVTQSVYGLHGLPLPPRRINTQSFPPEPASVTPAVLAATYKIGGVTPSGSEKVRQAVAEFQGQQMSSEDLRTFWQKYMPHAKPEDAKVHKFVGDKGEGSSGIEASLDIQYMMGVSPGILTEFWYNKDMDFCGDLKKWTQTILSTENPPLVHSVSYGWQGDMTTLTGCKIENVKDVDMEFAKLAARGITIVIASGDSGAGYSPPHIQCRPPPSVHNGTRFIGTVVKNSTARDLGSCCFSASEVTDYKGYTFEPPVMDTCDKQTRIEGVMFDGPSERRSASSADECCNKGLSQGITLWTYNSKAQECHYFNEVRGRHADQNSTSGMGNLPGEGRCLIYSAITGSKTDPLATSADASTASFKLWPSWPASSPWVTSVGSTRFVDQKVGQPEMATDQFGSGGGFSSMFDVFDDQKAAVAHFFNVTAKLPPATSFARDGRATPDVAGLGEGYQVVAEGHVTSVGGTSASTPMFAGLVSLLNEARVAKNLPPMGYINPWLYKHADAFTDITRGDNLRGRGPMVEPYGFNCTVGWDPVTGLGTPIFDKMLSAATSSSTEIVV